MNEAIDILRARLDTLALAQTDNDKYLRDAQAERDKHQSVVDFYTAEATRLSIAAGDVEAAINLLEGTE